MTDLVPLARTIRTVIELPAAIGIPWIYHIPDGQAFGPHQPILCHPDVAGLHRPDYAQVALSDICAQCRNAAAREGKRL